MIIRFTGAALTLLSGALYALYVTKEHRRKEAYLEELLLILEHFSWELQTNLAPLGICCAAAARCARGEMGKVFESLSQHLQWGNELNPAECMTLAMAQRDIPQQIRFRLSQLGDTLGRYDLSGQIGGIEAVRELCRRDLQALAGEHRKTVKSCQALGLCTGAAVAILLL